TYLKITFEVVGEDGEARRIEDFSPFDAPPSSPRHNETAKGKGRVKAVLEANRKSLSFGSVDEVPAALIGCYVSIVIGSRTRDGLRVPTVDSVEASRAGSRASSHAAE